jgi:indole-3-glycerol phosphate synthase
MDVLKKICKLKKDEIANLKKKDFSDNKFQIRNFLKKLVTDNKKKYNLIAEIKKSSPSKGLICKNFNLEKIAKEYQKAGAKCLSVLTETNFFQGNIKFISKVKKVVDIPILRKDFIIDEWQIYESYHSEADCILLIMAILNDSQYKKFYKIATELGMDVICEVHDEDELKRALKIDVKCIGINNRNLKTLKIDLKNFKKLSPKIPDNIIKICESGISSNEEIKEYSNFGADAFLVGESLMKSKNIYKETKYLINK